MVFAGDLTALTRYEGQYRAEVIDALAQALGKVGTRDPIGQAIKTLGSRLRQAETG